ncbi:MAG: hypothetical protein H6619_04065 [Deltaproteobacteria bacterium]|nr:hypothetical protein [Deltaproteobacteria bacterium]
MYDERSHEGQGLEKPDLEELRIAINTACTGLCDGSIEPGSCLDLVEAALNQVTDLSERTRLGIQVEASYREAHDGDFCNFNQYMQGVSLALDSDQVDEFDAASAVDNAIDYIQECASNEEVQRAMPPLSKRPIIAIHDITTPERLIAHLNSEVAHGVCANQLYLDLFELKAERAYTFQNQAVRAATHEYIEYIAGAVHSETMMPELVACHAIELVEQFRSDPEFAESMLNTLPYKNLRRLDTLMPGNAETRIYHFENPDGEDFFAVISYATPVKMWIYAKASAVLGEVEDFIRRQAATSQGDYVEFDPADEGALEMTTKHLMQTSPAVQLIKSLVDTKK